VDPIAPAAKRCTPAIRAYEIGIRLFALPLEDAMKAAGLGLLLSIAAATPTLATPSMGGERFPAVTIVAGEGVGATVANVLLPPPGETPVTPCPIAVSFFDGNGAQIGTTQALGLLPGVSASVPAASPPPGLVRAIVSISDTSRAQFCALKTALEIFDAKTGATRLIVPSATCIGLGQCATPLPGK
jgi:hypothetical protein